MIHKLSSSCFLFKLFSNLKFENSRARARSKYAVDNLKGETLVESGHVRHKIVPRVSLLGTRLARNRHPECWSGRSRTHDIRHGMRSPMLNQLSHRFENSSRPFTFTFTPTQPRSFQFASRDSLEILIVRSSSCVPHLSFWLLTSIIATGQDE